MPTGTFVKLAPSTSSLQMRKEPCRSVLTANFFWAASRPRPSVEESFPDFYNAFDICRCCHEPIDFCKTRHAPTRRRPRFAGPTARPASTTSQTLQQGKSNADSRQGSKMETTAASALPDNPFLHPAGGITRPSEHFPDLLLPPLEQEPSYLDTPHTPHPVGLLQQEDGRDARPETPNTERVANILANGPMQDPGEASATAENSESIAQSIERHENGVMASLERGDHAETWSATEQEAALDSQDAQGFAKLMFPDGDYIVTTHDVEIGRNMEIAAEYKRQQKEVKRAQQREQRRERVPSAQKELAQRELEEYQKEPSQPSMHGEDGQRGETSNSSNSLEGRPAAQATFSETGGALAFGQDSDEEAGSRRGRKKKRSMQHSKSSTSTTSVVPANLHPPVITAEYSQRELFTEDGEPYSRTLATLPVHTQRLEDIFKVSKKHLLFSFNFQEECWELHIFGLGAFVNDVWTTRGTIVALAHNDEIQVSSLTIVFKLPDSHRNSPGLSRGTFSQMGREDQDDLSEDEEEEVVGTSPVRRLSNALEDAESSEEERAVRKKGVPKLKLKGLKKSQKEAAASGAKKKPQQDEKASQKLSLKKQQRKKSDESPPLDEEKKVEKGKKPKEATKQLPEDKVEESIEGPTSAPVFTAEPGSALASVPIDELPQKRKGPGRPPKNGLVSKRDQALVKKKERDFEKAGLAAPPFNKILEMVRAETKQKEMLAKMQSGALPPGTEMPPAVETDLAAAAVKTPAPIPTTESGGQTEGVPMESSRRPSSPRPKRVARSPSPMKPETDYTEEELKKPNATYVHILDEILRDHPTGQADLQEIYDRIQKRYPHFKYRTSTQGWQSSVRHNLLSAPRFKETGKSGKGKLWTIDYDVPLEREKKRKPTPPPRPPMPMMAGQYSPYGQQPYGNGYGPPPNGQRPVQGGPGYYSPYAHGQPGQQAPGQNMPNRQGPQPPGHAPPSGDQASPQPDPFGGLVPEILALRNAFLAAHANESNMQSKSDWIGKCIMVFSNRFHGSGDTPDLTVEAPEEKKAYADLDTIFQKYEALKAKQKQEEQQKQQQQQQSAADQLPAQTAAPGTTQAYASHGNGLSQPGPPQQQAQTVQTAVADGVAYQNANGGVSPTASRPPVASTRPSQGAPAPVSGQTSTALGNGAVQGNAVASTHPPSATSMQSYQAPTTSPPVPDSTSQAPPQQGMPYEPPHPDSQRNLPPATISAPQNSTPPSVANANNMPTQTPPQSEAKPAGPAQHMEHPTGAGNSGTKRSAEDDETAENEAKRTKVAE